MSTELTWTSDVNRQVASAADAATQNKWELWYLCASLVGNTGLGFASNAGNWSVVRTCGSSDGTAPNLTSDTTDRLHLTGSGAFTANDWVFGANTTNGTGRSWALLQSPAAIGSFYMLVDFGNATGGKCDLAFGKTLSGNGSTTTAPTFSDGWSYTGAQFSINTITNTHRVSLQLSTRGDFWWFEAYDALASAYTVLAVTKLAGTHSIDSYTTVSLFAGGNTVNTTGFTTHPTATTYFNGTGATTLKGRSFNGTGAPQFVVPSLFIASGSSAQVIVITNYTAANFSDTTYNALPIYVLDVTNTDLKGRVPDLLWASGAAVQGSNLGVTTPFDYAKFGHCWMPWVSTSAPMI